MEIPESASIDFILDPSLPIKLPIFRCGKRIRRIGLEPLFTSFKIEVKAPAT